MSCQLLPIRYQVGSGTINSRSAKRSPKSGSVLAVNFDLDTNICLCQILPGMVESDELKKCVKLHGGHAAATDNSLPHTGGKSGLPASERAGDGHTGVEGRPPTTIGAPAAPPASVPVHACNGGANGPRRQLLMTTTPPARACNLAA